MLGFLSLCCDCCLSPLGLLNQDTVAWVTTVNNNSGGWKSKIMTPPDLVSAEGLFLGHRWSSSCCVPPGREETLVLSSHDKDTIPSWGLHLHNLIQWSPAFLAPGMGFMEDHFSLNGGAGRERDRRQRSGGNVSKAGRCPLLLWAQFLTGLQSVLVCGQGGVLGTPEILITSRKPHLPRPSQWRWGPHHTNLGETQPSNP